MSQINRFFLILAIAFFIIFLMPLFLPIAFFTFEPTNIPPFIGNIFILFWGYRWYDILFLAFAILASILALSSLFRPEKTPVHVEKAVIEGYEDLIEEEE